MFMTILFDFTVIFLTICICLFTYFKWKYLYWRNKKVPYIEPRFPFGTTGNSFTRSEPLAFVIASQYEYLKSQGHKWGGIYVLVSPSLLVVDLEIIKNIMLKDFQYFSDRGIYYNEKVDPLGANLFNFKGPRWRPLRAKLTPTFTSGKIKTMFPILLACSKPMSMAINELAIKEKLVNIGDVSARFTTDVIGSCAFGLECNSFKEPEDDFRKYGRMAVSFNSKMQIFKALLISATPSISRYLGVTLVSSEPKEFFLEVVKKAVTYRKTSKLIRNDFIQLLMNLKSEDSNGELLTIEEIAAQAFIFWVAGFETSSTTMAFCMYELAINQDIQNKVRKEIITVLEKYGELSYEAVTEMKYLSQVIDETLRKYPPAPLIPRICVQDYKLPDTDIILHKGTRVLVPVYGIHHDREYFPNPEKFDPDRFDDDNRENIRPFTYIPFGEGPRNCIGLRFGLLQSKVGLAVLLKDFRFLRNKRTSSPLQYERFNIVLTARGGIWLDIQKISKTET